MKAFNVPLLKKLWQNFSRFIVTSSELQVWQTSNSHGQTSFRAYDPATGSSACFGSEEDMRAWIEQLYYKK
ncbi:hypothetical protein NIES4075_33240 [Tolypothrix sp. NIES-4075]|uniref:hypothetical protein n=1 Tax=Tolypothrix sp. NIES-4075 TaxID=2005459 RepID=UPI000B5C41A1|nr:hypothetical protein [Tolypothrix sp. NIES-4075]GAX42323.1 hypothetical protein NIES4075_33240 [Tolypothrix sp. NIES-4075]